MPRTGEPGRSVSSRLLEILFAFRKGHEVMGLAEIERETGMPHATTRRLLLELTSAGAVDRLEDGRFTIGLRLWQLATLTPRTESLRILARPFIDDLYGALKQHVQLAVLAEDHAVIIERMSAPHAVPLASEVGGRLPLHCSGVGKVLLSHADADVIDQVLNGRLSSYTAKTVTDAAVLRRQFAGCRQTGIAVVRGELTNNADSVATRIVDAEGVVVAALSVVVRSDSVKLDVATPSVITTGLAISRALGWQQGVPVKHV